MRLIDLDAIMAQFPKADFDGDAIENMNAYPHWKTDITGLINILKSVPVINEHRQIAEWLKKHENYEDGIEKIKEQINCFKALEEWTEANAMEYALELLGVYKGEEVYHIKMGAVKDDRKTGDS